MSYFIHSVAYYIYPENLSIFYRNLILLQHLKKPSKRSDLDLVPGKDVVFVFKVYPPYTYEPHNRSNKVKHNMEIAILGHQTLNLLCDKIICDDMLMEVGGDISETPDIPVRQRLGVSFNVEKNLYFFVDVGPCLLK